LRAGSETARDFWECESFTLGRPILPNCNPTRRAGRWCQGALGRGAGRRLLLEISGPREGWPKIGTALTLALATVQQFDAAIVSFGGQGRQLGRHRHLCQWMILRSPQCQC